MDKKLKIGIIGYGRIGQIHLKNSLIHPMVKRVSICDPKKIEHSKSVAYYENYKDLISDERPDAVMICSPTPTHIEIIKYCCKKGVHIFCEKPVDLHLENIVRIGKKVKANNISLQVGFNRRFDPDFAQLKKRISEKEIGELYQITIFSRDPGLPTMDYIASSGGMMMDMTIHDFDMCRFLTDSEVSEVYAKGQIRVDKRLRKHEDIDTATVLLTMKNMVTCTIQNSRSSVYGYDQRIEVFGSKGMITVDNNNAHRMHVWTSDGAQSAPPLNFFLERYASSYKIELDAFVNSIVSQSKVPVSLEDALKATTIATLANQSIDKGQPIKMSS